MGMIKQTPRYKSMVQLVNIYKPKTLVGHSLSGYMIQQYKKDNPNITSRVYGSPIVDFSMKKSQDRFAHYLDPIASFDTSVQRRGFKLNPHSIYGYN
jgi:hypothetical protein